VILLGNQSLYNTFPIGSESLESALLVATAGTSRGLSGNYLIALRTISALSLLILNSFQLLEQEVPACWKVELFFTHSKFEEKF
jgi:hypothetical protein